MLGGYQRFEVVWHDGLMFACWVIFFLNFVGTAMLFTTSLFTFLELFRGVFFYCIIFCLHFFNVYCNGYNDAKNNSLVLLSFIKLSFFCIWERSSFTTKSRWLLFHLCYLEECWLSLMFIILLLLSSLQNTLIKLPNLVLFFKRFLGFLVGLVPKLHINTNDYS